MPSKPRLRVRLLLIVSLGAFAVPAQQATTPTPQPPVANGLRVRVLDHGKPAPDARLVRVETMQIDYTAQRDAAERAHPGDEPAFYEALATHGVVHALDESGSTRVPPLGGLLIAQRGATWAILAVSSTGSPTPVTLELRGSRTARAHVTTADGRPAAQVRLGVVHASGTEAFFVDTDAAGDAALRLVDRHGDGAKLRALVGTRQPLEVPLPPDGAAATLALPPCAPVDATLVGDLAPGAHVRWWLRLGQPPRLIRPTRGDERHAHFAFVELGVTPTVAATVDQRTVDPVEVPAVRAAGEAVRLERTFRHPVVVVRLVDGDGAPLANRHVTLQWSRGSARNTATARSNAAGWAELMPAGVGAEVQQLDVLVHETIALSPAVLGGRLQCKDVGRGRTVLGDLACTPLPIVARGTLREPDGRPATGVALRVGAGGRQALTSDERGAFVVRMPQPAPAELELRLGDDWYFAEEPYVVHRLATGDASTPIVVQRAARLRLHAAGMPARTNHQFRFVLERADAPNRTFDLQPDLAARELRMPPGHWHFTVHHGNAEVLRLDNVHAASGVETHEPRFMAFDWQAFARVITLRLENPDGAPCSQATVWLRHQGSGSGSSPDERGEIRLLVPKDGGHVTIDPDDKRFASIDLGIVTTDQVVRLGAGPRVVVQIDGLLKLPADYRLMLRGDAHGTNEGIAFDEHGRAELWLPATGAFRPQLAVLRETSSHVLDLHVEPVDVPAGGASVPLRAVDVLRAIDQLQLGR